MTSEAQKDYARGYRAGRKRTEAEVERGNEEFRRVCGERKRFRREALKDIFASLIGITPGQWRVNGEVCKTGDDYLKLAKQLTDKLMNEAFQ